MTLSFLPHYITAAWRACRSISPALLPGLGIANGKGALSQKILCITLIYFILIEKWFTIGELDILAGRAWKFKDDIDTDAIIPGRYLVMNDPQELAAHLFEGVRPEMAGAVKEGDYVVAGENFGCGSSREHAPLALKGAGISAVLAKSFARIFFRNAINIGLPLFICPDVDRIEEGAYIEIDMAGGVIKNITRNESYKTTPLPSFLREIVNAGGLVEYTRLQVSGVRA